MARKEREYTWYLEPRGDFAWSNEVISKNVKNPEDFLIGVICEHGETHDLWRCLPGEVFKIWQSRKNWGKNFKVGIFAQEGKSQIRDVTEWYRRRHQKSPKKGQVRNGWF
ncbi:MAG: hypothetical protein ABSA74_01235 [Candidatus Staskawiczbacteria bacterium]|jgi:hypothetical protein